MRLDRDLLFSPLELPCGVKLRNRIVRSAMSGPLGTGGYPTGAGMRLYERWAKAGVAASIVGEVLDNPHFAEKPGNLVLNSASDLPVFEKLAQAGSAIEAHLSL